jgi:PAS domain S-box-containing protein
VVQLDARTGQLDKLSRLDIERLVHELGTYQIELEMQNEELRRTQAELEESRARYADLFEFAPVGYFTFDEEGLIRSANLNGASMLTVAREELLRKSFVSFVWKEDRDIFRLHKREVLAGDGPQSCELRLKKGQDVFSYAHLESVAIRDNDGHVRGIMATVSDITGRRVAEEELECERAVLAGIVDATDVMLAYLDPGFNFVWVNPAYAEACKRRPEELIGKNHFALYPHAENEVIFRRVRRTGEPVFHKDKPFEYPDQPERGVTYWDWSLVPIKDSGDRVVGLVFSLRETTKYKQAELTLVESEERFRRIAETSGDVIFQIDPKGMITYGSPAMQSFGYTADQMLHRDFSRFVAADDLPRALEALRRASAGERVGLFEVKIVRADGSVVDCEVSAAPIMRDGTVIAIQGIARDISGRKLGETALKFSMQRFSLLAGSADRLLRSTEPQKAVESICREVMEFLDCHVFFNLLIDKKTGGPRLNAYAGISEDEAQQIKLLDCCAGVFGSATRDAIRIVGGRVSRGEDEWTELVKSYGIRAYACHPLLGPEEKGIGTLFFGSRTRETFSEDDLSLMKAVADQVSAAMTRMGHEQELRRAHDELEIRVEKRTAELKRLSAALRDERQRFFDVLETLPAYIVLLAPNYEVRFANRVFRDLFGEHQGRCCYSLQFGGAEPCGNCGAHPVSEIKISQEREWTGPDGREYHVYYFPFVDTDGSILTLEAGLDVTERKRAENELRALGLKQELLAARLRALAVELTQVEDRERRRLAGLLHDHLQQLLVAARLRLESIGRSSRPDLMRTGVGDTIPILDEAIRASRSLTIELSPPILHTAGLVAGLGWLTQWFAEKNDLKVTMRSDDIAQSDVEEIRFLLFECVRELLFNVVKHAGVSEATVTLMQWEREWLRVVVRDEGRGFDPGILRKRNFCETTFGLFSIEQRLQHIGGGMEIETGPGKGTCVTLTVPLAGAQLMAEATGEPSPGQLEGGRPVCAGRETISVLLVDDHKIMREGLASLLESEPDIEVVGEAADGPSAIELAERLQPAVIIMDVNLGDMSGVEATEIIMKRNAGVKVIGLSMHIDREIKAAMRKAGAVVYLTKGGPLDDLVEAIRACASDSVRANVDADD